MIQYVVFGITYAFAAVVQPGPFQVFLLNQVLSKGWKKTLPAAFGPLISDVPVFIITLFLLNNFPHKVISILQAAGGLFLLYLAFNSYKTWKYFNPEQSIELHSGQTTLMKAVIVNLLNPNPYIGWSLILGPIFLKGWHDDSGKRYCSGGFILCHFGFRYDCYNYNFWNNRQIKRKGK